MFCFTLLLEDVFHHDKISTRIGIDDEQKLPNSKLVTNILCAFFGREAIDKKVIELLNEYKIDHH